MKLNSRIFAAIGVLALAISITYWILGKDVGMKLLLSFFVFALFIYSFYFDRIAKSHGNQPEDDPEGTPATAAGEAVGVFPVHSVFPLIFVIGGAVFAFGLIFGFAMWAAGSAILLGAVVGLVTESRE